MYGAIIGDLAGSIYEFDNLKILISRDKILKKPFKKGQKVGEIKIYALNNLIFSQEIYTIIGIN